VRTLPIMGYCEAAALLLLLLLDCSCTAWLLRLAHAPTWSNSTKLLTFSFILPLLHFCMNKGWAQLFKWLIVEMNGHCILVQCPPAPSSCPCCCFPAAVPCSHSLLLLQGLHTANDNYFGSLEPARAAADCGKVKQVCVYSQYHLPARRARQSQTTAA